MRKGLIPILMLAILGSPAARAGEMLQGDVSSDGSRIISVTRHGSGPVVEHLTLGRHKAAIIQLDSDARDVLVSDPKTLDAVIKTPRRIFLLGTETGQASAYFFDAAGKQILTLDVRVERDVSELARVIRETMPDSDVKISALNDDIVLTGTVANSIEPTRAAELAAHFAVDADKPPDPTKVENLLTVKNREQVMLKVRVAEMAHTIAKQFGVNMGAAAPHILSLPSSCTGGTTGLPFPLNTCGAPLSIATANPYGLAGSALSASSGASVGLGQVGKYDISAQLNALDQVGLSHTLAEPNLIAVSGETAKFLAGGEFPVPVSRDQYGNITVSFKDFGVGLTFTPVVESENRISLQLATEVSELTTTGSFLLTSSADNLNGSVSIPALAVRRAETTVELPSGGSFAIAGLLQNTTKQVIDAFPGLKELPVLGALFRSRDFQNNETELVMIVTAYVVNPTSETKLAAPSDGFVPPSDAQTILFGRLNAVYGNDPNGLKSAGDSKTGFIVE
jgi:pilus assembly protein CpaC